MSFYQRTLQRLPLIRRGFAPVCTRFRKLKHLEHVSQLKEDPFALNSNYSFEIVILVMFLKDCQNLFSFALLIMPTALSGGGSGGGGGGGLVKFSFTLRLGIYLIKRRAYFETTEKLQYTPFDFEIGKCDSSDAYLLRQLLSNWLALSPNLISTEKRKQKLNYGHIIQKLKNWLEKQCHQYV